MNCQKHGFLGRHSGAKGVVAKGTSSVKFGVEDSIVRHNEETKGGDARRRDGVVVKHGKGFTAGFAAHKLGAATPSVANELSTRGVEFQVTFVSPFRVPSEGVPASTFILAAAFFHDFGRVGSVDSDSGVGVLKLAKSSCTSQWSEKGKAENGQEHVAHHGI